MKVTRNICLDVKVAELLKKEKNASTLINSYLINYFGLNCPIIKEGIKEAEPIDEEINKEIDEVFYNAE